MDRRAPQFLKPPGRTAPWRAGLLKLGSALFLLGIGLLLSNPPHGQVQVALLGDLMLGRGVAERQSNHSSSPLAHLTGELQAADLALGNLESPLTDQPLLNPTGYDLRANPGVAAWLAESGLDGLSLANNHSLDSGPSGLAETRSALSQAGLAWIATGDPPLRYKINGVEVVILAYEAVTRPLDLETIAADVRAEKLRPAVVIVSLHWGGEFRPAPDPAQRQEARLLAQAGADLIWGHHPHVPQPVEWIARPGPFHPTLVIYSLGNALFDQESPPDARWGALLKVNLEAEGVSRLDLQPFEINLRQGGIQEADLKTASAIRARLQLPGDISSRLFHDRAGQ